MQLIQPIWLYAIAGIAVPVAIHLWHNKQGRVLRIGSIGLLDRSIRKKARSRRVSDWWLLVLRCLLLTLLALLLAGPYWERSLTAGEKQGWVLPGGPAAGTSQTILDSLVRRGFQRHDLNGSSWWAAFRTLDRQAPPGIPFYVLTDGRLEHFSGIRPTSGRRVYWHIDTPKDSTARWVQASWDLGPDSMAVVTGNSGATGTSYTHRAAGKDTTSLDTIPLRVAVYMDDIYSRDGQWVTGAVTALQQFTRRKIIVESYKLPPGGATAGRRLPGPGVHPDWVFWLSSQPPPSPQSSSPFSVPPQGAHASNTLLYQPGRPIPVDTWIKGSDIPVEKVSEQSGQWQPVWTDGFGRPLLALEETAHGRYFHFFSHFDPAWNGLVWSPDFPVRIYRLLLEQQIKGPDKRVIDPAQVTPSPTNVSLDSAPILDTTVDLSPFTWLLLFITLLIERILSSTTSKND